MRAHRNRSDFSHYHSGRCHTDRAQRIRRARLRRGRSRRGVLLLVIMGLLAMFGLVAVAFVVLSGHAERSSKVIQRIEQYPEWPDKDLHQAALVILRGSYSPVGVHSLLEDIYGHKPREVGQMSAVQQICGGQLFEFMITGDVNPSDRVGCVMTMLDGPFRGQSTLIVGLSSAGGCQAFVFKEGSPMATMADLQTGLPHQGNLYVINGVPFAGTGAGFDPSTGRTNLSVPGAAQGNTPVALLPGWQGLVGTPDVLPPGLLGGANEDYDAVDFQNMFLAAQIPIRNPTTGQIARVATIPSFHRPSLVRHWMNQSGAGGGGMPQGLMSQIMLRPVQDEFNHPNFTGSNPGAAGVFNPAWDGISFGQYDWDVDNDGDGFMDGIWVDVGLPIRSTADGRQFKPLVSFLCVDMDGRLNVNAHGTLAQTTSQFYQGVSTQVEAPLPGFAFAGGTDSAMLPRGQGYGPPEINLWPLLTRVAGNDTSRAAGIYSKLLGFGPTVMGNMFGRYGSNGQTPPRPGLPGFDDRLSWNDEFEYRNDPSGDGGTYWSSFSSIQNSYGTPYGLDGLGAIGLDMGGRPLYLSMDNPQALMGAEWINSFTDDPYELDLSIDRARGGSSLGQLDSPFSPAELERVLRPFDVDSTQLPVRLTALGEGTLHHARHALTSESWDLPCPGLALPSDISARLTVDGQADRVPRRAYHLTDLLRTRTPDPAIWRQLLPPEMLAGRKLNLNRPLGNGLDDNGNGIVDEPAEFYAGGEMLTVYNSPQTTAQVAFDHLNTGTPGSGPYTPGQMQARYLYVLVMLLADRNYLVAQLGSDEEVARYVAQWAVNVVDFRDRDSIMTRFDYDPNPFDGWSVSGSSARRVWGCERPQLVISETLAFHDRQTDDEEIGGYCEPPAEPADPDNPDDYPKEEEEGDQQRDFDSVRRPKGSLFVELYNPWSPLDAPAGEFEFGGGSYLGGVFLGQAQGGSPVWRMAIVDENDSSQPAGRDPEELLDPDDPDPTKRPRIERAVYFVPQGGGQLPTDAEQNYFASGQAGIVPAGRYAVIGPGSATGDPTTYIGLRNGAQSGDNSTRRIELVSRAPMVYNNSSTQPPAAQVHPPAVVVVNQPHRLSVSEPIDDPYPPAGAGGKYEPALDMPLDKARGEDAWQLLGRNQTVTGFRIIHLQRLADPTQPYDARTNPYRTIDSMPIDLTAFNGASSKPEPDFGGGGGRVAFASRQRGESSAADGLENNIWKQEPRTKTVGGGGGVGAENHHFSAELRHSLGYLNFQYFGPPTGGSDFVKGSPQRPFPWLTWNNRPYISQYELLQVPVLRSSKLLARHETERSRYFDILRPGEARDAYNPGAEGPPFAHLMNFFDSKAAGAGTSPQFHRILDFVHVPSRFTGTTVHANPELCQGGDHWFHPPFNRISRYREPGKINLNTIFSQEVFAGLMAGAPTTMQLPAFWQRFIRSRRGGSTTTTGTETAASLMLKMDDTNFSPSRFARPFRSAGGASMVPDVLRPANEIDVTLLRRGPGTNRPLFAHQSNMPYDDTDRNPYFRYQGLQRLGNLTTTRSNVYAVWITVGYFEVAAWPGGVDPQHPDGMQLGQELGADTGEVKRHRAFYMFDRSIPVGFQRGEDLNVEKAILVKRFIE